MTVRYQLAFLSLLILSLPILTPGQGTTSPACRNGQATAFVHVNVIPMDRERILKDQTVIIRDGKIVEVGPSSKVAVPRGSLRIDGRGKFLVPGLDSLGGRITAGSDTPEVFLLYGWTLHRELRSLVKAGLTPYGALEAATRNPAEYLKALDYLLEANPLDSIANTERRAGVMVRGQWLPKRELQQRLDEIALRFIAASDAPPQPSPG